MDTLIKVWKTEKGNQAVSGRDLHKFLDIGREFANWIKGRIEKYGFIENKDFYKMYYDQNGNNIPIAKSGNDDYQRVIGGRIEYVLTISMAKELAMVENNEKGREARKYFIECEEKFKAATLNNTLDKQIQLEKIRSEKWSSFAKVVENAPDSPTKSILYSIFVKEETGHNDLKIERPSFTATEVCNLLKERYGYNISKNKLGRLAKKYDMKKDEYGYFIHYTSTKQGNIDLFKYYENAVARFKEIIQLERNVSIIYNP
jgi:anti-repressor protein